MDIGQKLLFTDGARQIDFANMHRGIYYAKYCSGGRWERDCCMGDKLKMHLLGKNLIRGKREEKIDHKGV